MDTMDAQLAQIYGTGQPEAFDADDLQKTAAAELLVKLADEQNIDLNQYSDEEIGELVEDLYTEKTAAEEAAAAAAPPFPPKKKEEKEEEKEEKVAEADFLGRVMAHAYNQELENIEKEAGAKWDALKGGASGAWKSLKDVKGRGQSAAAHLRQARHGRSISGQKLTKGQQVKDILRAGKKVSPELLAGAGLTTGIAAAMRKKSSADESALEAMAQQYAFEMAKEAGYIDDHGNALVEIQQEKEASALDMAVHGRALEICAEAGLPVEWDE